MHKMTLTHIKKGVKVKVVDLSVSKQIAVRLSSLGLRPGVLITKINAFALKGPVTVKIGRTTIALGHSMAEKIFVEI